LSKLCLKYYWFLFSGHGVYYAIYCRIPAIDGFLVFPRVRVRVSVRVRVRVRVREALSYGALSYGGPYL